MRPPLQWRGLGDIRVERPRGQPDELLCSGGECSGAEREAVGRVVGEGNLHHASKVADTTKSPSLEGLGGQELA